MTNYTNKTYRGPHQDVLEVVVDGCAKTFYFQIVDGGFRTIVTKPKKSGFMTASKIHTNLDDAVSDAFEKYQRFMREAVVIC